MSSEKPQATQDSSSAQAAPLSEADRDAPEILWGPAALTAKREEARQHQAHHASRRERWIRRNRFLYESVKRLFRFIVEPDKRVLHQRCSTGLFLDSVRPSEGLGVEISHQMVELAKERFPQFEFVESDPENFVSDKTFDYVLFSDLSDTADVQEALKSHHSLCERHTRLVIYTYNHLWELPVEWASKIGLRMPTKDANWLSEQDIKGLLELSGYKWLHTYQIVLIPKWIPLISTLINRFAARIPLIRNLSMIKVLVARPVLEPRRSEEVSVSVIIPCKNERDNVELAVQRIPDMGSHTEIIFCDDKSTDGTADVVREMQQKYASRDIKLVDGPGICKAKNVWAGFNAASGDVLMILDADLTVMPEELPRFFDALVEGKGEFINGSRLVYPMQKFAMKHANMFGNVLFSTVFSFLLDQPIKDTLCGTKVLWRDDWERLKPSLNSWGTEDLWGDYELLLGASKLNLQIIDLPIHYQERLYGSTKMVNVFRNGLRMLRICWAAFLKLKLSY